jgi:hypothetical protein
MNVSVGSGRGWFNDRWIDNDAAIQLTVLASEAVLPRIDTVVIEINSDISTRANSIKVIKGTPASSPVPPTMANTSTLHQYPLADISIPANDTDITAGQITNRIGMAGGTPFITGVLTSFDVSTLFGQFESNFDAWFANLQNQLDANQASNLQNQIDSLVSQNRGWIPITETWVYNNPYQVAVPSDATTRYAKYMLVRLKQGGGFKYFMTWGVSTILLDFFPLSNYSLIQAAITDVSVSFIEQPFGFPSKSLRYTVPKNNGYIDLPFLSVGSYSTQKLILYISSWDTLNNNPLGNSVYLCDGAGGVYRVEAIGGNVSNVVATSYGNIIRIANGHATLDADVWIEYERLR